MPKIRGIQPDYWTDEAIVELLGSLSVRAMGAELVYGGPMPARPLEYYNLATRSATTAFVYALTDSSGHHLYVGKSRNPGSRFDRHRRRDWWQWVSRLSLIQVRGEDYAETQAMAMFVEARAIWKLAPIYNVAGVR